MDLPLQSRLEFGFLPRMGTPVSIGVETGPRIGVQKGPLRLWRVPVVHGGFIGECGGQSRPKPRGGLIASSSVRSSSQIVCNASAVALPRRLSGKASSQATY